MAEALQSIFDQLRRPFPSSAISWRVGSTYERDGQLFGLPLAYIDARDVMDRLDEVVGPAAWQDKYTTSGPKTICAIGINIGDQQWIWKEDGAGDTDFEAEKGALSDAFKRAAVRWGIGRYLYGLKTEWIKVEKRGKTTIIPDAAYDGLYRQHDKAITDVEWGDREDRNSHKLLVAALTRLATHDLEEWETKNAAIIRALPVAAQGHLKQRIEQLGASAARKEAAEWAGP